MLTDHSVLFIVNPEARGGKTGKNWDKTYAKIKKHLTHQSDFIIANGIGTGITSTMNAISDGDYTLLVAVGGEGTVNEVINGMFMCNSNLPLGFIKGGTVNDYLKVISWPKGLEDQIEVINRGISRRTPLVKATGDESRVILNIGDIGVSSSVGHMASIQRKLKWVRGSLRYSILALQAIAKWENIPSVVTTDNQVIEGGISIFSGGFSSHLGDYKILPQAITFGEKMGYAVAMDYKKLEMVKMMGVLKRGEHTSDTKGVYMGHSSKLKIEADRSILMSVDGEPFTFNSDTIELESLPQAINILDPNI